MVLGPRIRQLHSPGGVSNHQAILFLVHEERPACHSFLIMNLCENARFPLLDD